MRKGGALPEHPIFFKGSRIESSIPKEHGVIRRKGKAQTASQQQLRTAGSTITPKGDPAGSRTVTASGSTPHLAEMSSHVQALQKKLEPMLARVEQATKNVEMARRTHAMANNYVDGKPHLKALLSE